MSCRVLIPLLFLLLPLHVRAVDSPYDVLEHSFRPYVQDDADFAMKVKSVAADPYKFWRGTKDFYYLWCKSNVSAWMADRNAFVISHGDLHFGNIGAYATGPSGQLAFGMVDFDEACKLPFQIELLHGAITLKLVALVNNIDVDDSYSRQLIKTMVDSYSAALLANRDAEDLLWNQGDPVVDRVLATERERYSRELETFTTNGRFRPVVLNEEGKPKEVLQPALERADDIAASLSQAIRTQPNLQRLFRFSSAAEIRSAIRDIALRTRIDSSGSQGLTKLLVLMYRPLKGIDHDVILYLKQEIPSAPERAGLIPPDPRPAGQRAAEAIGQLTSPAPYLTGWCQIGKESYWLSFKEPWSDELSPKQFNSRDSLLRASRILGTIAGSAHALSANPETIRQRLTPLLVSQLQERSDTYVKKTQDDFAAFANDPRVQKLLSEKSSGVADLRKH